MESARESAKSAKDHYKEGSAKSPRSQRKSAKGSRSQESWSQRQPNILGMGSESQTRSAKWKSQQRAQESRRPRSQNARGEGSSQSLKQGSWTMSRMEMGVGSEKSFGRAGRVQFSSVQRV